MKKNSIYIGCHWFTNKTEIDKKKSFYGLQKTDNKLNGLEKHQKLIESYIKLHQHRQRS